MRWLVLGAPLALAMLLLVANVMEVEILLRGQNLLSCAMWVLTTEPGLIQTKADAHRAITLDLRQ
jgi:hypothetical protein